MNTDPLHHYVVTILCDDPSHAPRRAVVRRFKRAVMFGRVHWSWLHDSRDKGDPAVHLHHDEALTAPGWTNREDITNEGIRTRYELACGKCPPRRRLKVIARQERLFEALENAAQLGVSELTLRHLAANL